MKLVQGSLQWFIISNFSRYLCSSYFSILFFDALDEHIASLSEHSNFQDFIISARLSFISARPSLSSACHPIFFWLMHSLLYLVDAYSFEIIIACPKKVWSGLLLWLPKYRNNMPSVSQAWLSNSSARSRQWASLGSIFNCAIGTCVWDAQKRRQQGDFYV